jgi:threonine aldolase
MDLPPPPACSFASDNAAGVHPEVLEALAAANAGPALAYGDDPWTAGAIEDLRERFEAPVEVQLCWGGTGANVVGLATLVHPWQAILTTDSAHIVVDECGAPARFTGATVMPIAGVDGKLTPALIEPYLEWLGVEHHPQPRVVCVSQATEVGTVYTADELGALADACHANGLLLHVDGARIANALVATGSTLASMVRDTGVDAMTFGFTKNGAMYGEAVVHLRPELAAHAAYVRKQAGQLVSKSRFVGAQLSALLRDDLWLRSAAHANEMAALLHRSLAAVPQVEVPKAPQVNGVFARIPWDRLDDLSSWAFFWPWDPSDSMVRWMTSFATTPADVAAFVTGVGQILGDQEPAAAG